MNAERISFFGLAMGLVGGHWPHYHRGPGSIPVHVGVVADKVALR
jgi:hypothetical protein